MSENEIPKATVLVVDDEQDHAQVMCEALQRQGHRCDVTFNLAEAEARLKQKSYDVIVTDLVMDGKRDGLEVLRKAKTLTPPPQVILVSAHGDIPIAVQAMNEGAYGFIEKPLDLNHFRAQVNRAAELASLQKQNQILRDELTEQSGFEGIVGKSAAMQRVLTTARQVAASDIPVLIMGESGTGKELIARAIHYNSRRRKKRLVALNCAGLSENILEDELFGHVKGAFTGAQSEREGRFEHADGGTLFMDEIGDMPAVMQAKLLRVLENGEVVRLGSNEPIKVDVRLISATNRESRRDGGREAVPRGLVLSDQGRDAGLAAAARTPRGHPAADPLFSAGIRREIQSGDRRDLAGGAADACVVQLAGEHPAASHGAGEHGGADARTRFSARNRFPPRYNPARRTEQIAGMNNLVGISIEAGGKGTDPQYIEDGGWKPRTGGQDPAHR